MMISRILIILCLIISNFSVTYAAPAQVPQITVQNDIVHIPVRGEIAAVVYERGPRTWVVQNTPQFWSKNPAKNYQAKVYYQNFVSAISFITPAGKKPEVKYEKKAIRLAFVTKDEKPAAAPEYKKQPISGNIELILPPQEKPGKPIKFDDPDHKDTLMLVPVKTDQYSIDKALKFVDFKLLKTTVGLTFQPYIDNLLIEPKKGSVLVSSDEGLHLAFTKSPEAFIPLPPKRKEEPQEKEPLLAEAKVAPSKVVTPPVHDEETSITEVSQQLTQVAAPSNDLVFEITPFLRIEEWETNIPFAERMNELQEAVYDRSGEFLIDEAYNLARFYVTYGMGPEARNILKGIADKVPDVVGEARHIGLKALASLLLDEFYEAAKLLVNPLLDKDPRIVTWRWIANFLQHVEEGDKTSVLPGTVRINHMPHELKYAVLSRLMKNALRVEDFDSYVALSELARFDIRRPAERFYLTYLDGWHNYLIDQTDTAFDIWEYVAENGDRLNAVQARYAYVYKGIEAARLTRAEVLRELEYLTYAWRGDDFEHKTRYMLAKMLLEDGRLREALLQFKALIMQFPSHPQAPEITARMTGAFADFMLKKSNRLPKIDVIAMFEEFKELTPIGEQGDQIYYKVANFYLDLSLPDEAEPIFQHLAKFKLQGEQKANAGMKLCNIYMDKAKWGNALKALAGSEAKDVSENVTCEREELRAHILLNQGHFDHVISSLSDKNDSESQRLKAQAHVGLKDWSSVQKIYSDLLRALPEGEKLDTMSQFDVLNYSIALVFENDFDSLAGVKEKYGDEMKKSRFGAAFDLVSSSLSGSRVRDLTKEVAKLANVYQQYKMPQNS